MTDKNVCPTGREGIGDWRFERRGASRNGHRATAKAGPSPPGRARVRDDSVGEGKKKKGVPKDAFLAL